MEMNMGKFSAVSYTHLDVYKRQCAYCVGMLIGKHKMAPVLSPKKSIEGLSLIHI